MLVRLRHILYDAGVYARERERGETERNLPCENEAIWSEHVAELFALCLKDFVVILMVSKWEVEARLHENRCDLHHKDHPYWTVSSSYNEALYFLRSRLIHSIRLQLEAKTCPCD